MATLGEHRESEQKKKNENAGKKKRKGMENPIWPVAHGELEKIRFGKMEN